jgi:hypothetical protein
MGRTPDSDPVQQAVEKLGYQYEKRPMDFFAESDLQSRLYEYLRAEFDDSNKLTVSYPGNNAMGVGPVSFINERQKTKSFQKQIEKETKNTAKSSSDHHLTRVHTEIYAREQFGLNSNNRLDIAILAADQHPQEFRPVFWENGKQKASVEGMSGAIEVKYLRNRVDFRQKIGSINPKNASVSKIASEIDLSINDIKKDLTKSDYLGDPAGYDLDTVFVLMSNYDCLHRGRNQNYNRSGYGVDAKIGDAVVESIDQQYDDVAVFYSTPVPSSSCWLV